MIDDSFEGVEPDLAFADLFVPVFVRGEGVHRIVAMNRLETIKTDHPVELGENSVEVADDVVSAVPDMTGVQTDAEKRLNVER